MAKGRKKVFPKAPIPFNSKLEHTLGKNSNKHLDVQRLALYYYIDLDNRDEKRRVDNTLKSLRRTINKLKGRV
jgi:septation ring formation regulator EzrA